MNKKPVARWSLQDAKAQFSEVVRRALDAPQIVTKNGEETAVVVSVREFNRLMRRGSQESFGRFLARSPLKDVELEIRRPRESGRAVKL